MSEAGDGKPRSARRKRFVQLGVRQTPDEAAELRQLCAAWGTGRQATVRRAIRECLEREATRV